MNTNYLEVLSHEEILRIDYESRKILEEVGVKVLHKECLDLLIGLGCSVGKESNIVKMPSDLIQKAIDSSPESFKLYGRDPENFIELGGDIVNFGPGGFAVFAEDLDSGRRRRALRKDLIEHLKVSDALQGCEFNHVNVMPSDIPDEISDLEMWADSLIYQTKPIMNENYSSRSVDLLVEMGSIIRGSQETLLEKPHICLDVCVVSPLTHDTRQVNILMKGAEYGLPMSVEAGPIAGASSPVTLAACISQSNAEVLSALVIAYAVKPGSKILYGSWARHMDMRYGSVTMGGPEYAILKVCTAQLGRFYGIPTRGGGALTDSHLSDTQAGYEKMQTTLIPALAGINYISGMGLNETENLQSLPQLVIDDEIVSMVKRVTRGIEVSRQHLATDLIISVGPGGNYLKTDHTNQYFKQEFLYPILSNREVYESWSGKGALSTKEKAREKVKELLKNSPEESIDPKKIDDIRNIVKKEKERIDNK